MRFFNFMAGETRLELAAFCVTGRRSDQLNYSPASHYQTYNSQLSNVWFCVNTFFAF